MNHLNCYRLYKDAIIPKNATTGSACFDLSAYIDANLPVTVYDMNNKRSERKPEWYDKQLDPKFHFRIDPADRVLIPTGLIFRIPIGHSIRLHTRSSTSLKKGLIMPNGEGIIDSDYYHQTYIMLLNTSADAVYIENGERLAQGELIMNEPCDIVETPEVPEKVTERSGGFGSTGVN